MLAEAVAAAPARTDPLAWAENRAWLYGRALYDASFFWEAHEVWEPVWQRTQPNSEARSLIACLIHLANACLKLEMMRPKAAQRLSGLARGELIGLSGTVMGVPVVRLLAGLERFDLELRVNLDGALTSRPILHAL